MRRKEFLLLAGPSALVMTVLLVVPLIQTIMWSLQDVTYGEQGVWTGLSNYVNVLSDGLFRQAVVFTIALTLVGLVFMLVLGFLLAVLLQRTGRARPLFLGFLLLSYIVPTVDRGRRLLLAVRQQLRRPRSTGSCSTSASRTLRCGSPTSGPTGSWSSPTSSGTSCRSRSSILLAGLQGVNTEAIEAAQIDGASWWQQQRYVVIPALRPADRLHLAHHDHGRAARVRRPYSALSQRGLPRATSP